MAVCESIFLLHYWWSQVIDRFTGLPIFKKKDVVKKCVMLKRIWRPLEQ